MQVFKTYFMILKKRLFAVLIYVILFLGITIFMTFDIAKEDTTEFDIQKVPVLVINEEDQTKFIDGLLEYMENYVVYVEVKDTEEARKDALFYREVEYILTIPEGFTDAFLSNDAIPLIKQTIPNSIEALSVDSAIDNYLNTARVYLDYMPNISFEELNNYVNNNLEEDTTVSFDITSEDVGKGSNQYNKYYYDFLAYIIIAGFITAVSTVMFSFHGIDIRRRHHASPVSVRKLDMQLIFANFVFVMCYLLIFIIAGFLCNPFRRLNANTLLFWANAFIFALTALSMSYLIGITVKNKKAVGAMATAISLSLSFISGIFVPQELLGEAVLRVASFTPTYWYVKVNNMIGDLTNYSWSSLSQIFSFMAIQVGFAAAIISIALVVSKRKRQQVY